LSGLLKAQLGWTVDLHSVQSLRERLLDELEERGWPPIFLDEADRLDRQRNGAHFLDIVRDLHDHGRSAFVLFSIQRLARKWASPTAYFEAFTTRTAARIDFERPDLGDAEALARAACRVGLGRDLVADCLSVSGGSMRPLMARFREVEGMARAAGLDFIDLPAWRRLCTLSGDAPAPARRAPAAQTDDARKERAA
jgi:DNA transposition AAA+ family ATPase